MTTFAERNWNERETTLGDPAEKAFEHWANDNHIVYARYGLNRPPFPIYELPTFIRHTPDYVTATHLIEVQGCGHDQTFKFKHDKLWAMVQWDEWMEVKFWLWNQPQNTGHTILLRDLFTYVTDPVSLGFRMDGMFDGHKPYSTVTWLQLTGGRWDVT